MFPKKKTCRSSRTGFTLVEIMVVVVLLAAVSAVVVVRLPEVYHQSRTNHSVAEVIAWLGRVREDAVRNQRPAIVTIDLARGIFSHRPAGREEGCRELRVSSTLRIKSVRTAEDEIEQGEAELPFTIHGRSPSFALQLLPTDRSPRWIFVVGGSGETLQFSSEEVDDALRLLQTRAHAG